MRGSKSPGVRAAPRWAAAVVVVVVVSLVPTLAGLAAAPAGARVAVLPGGGQTLMIGNQLLRACGGHPVSYCGRLSVPLDPSLPTGPMISIAYRWYPALSPPGGVATGTVVPVEGGPGFPTIGSVPFGFQRMYGPLLNSWNMLAVDLRGTGLSAPIDCPTLQNFVGSASGMAYNAVVRSCALHLNHHWKTATGLYVHASDLFTSAVAASDVAAVIHALGIAPVDLYGDSYGSFFAQTFARRYPSLVRSVVLDSTYATEQLDPWYRSTMTEAYTACAAWPAPTEAQSPTAGQPTLPSTMPVLILGGELDTWTPPSGVGQVMSELGGASRFVELANRVHVVGEGATDCGAALVRAFVQTPAALDTMDTSCATSIPPLDAVGSYPEP